MMQQLGFKQLLQGFAALVILIIFVWLAFYALLFLLVVSIGASLFFYGRRFLREKGILKQPESAFDAQEGYDSEAASAPIIEGDYIDVDAPENDALDSPKERQHDAD